MATMIPSKILNFDKASKEDIMFESLERLPKEYIVFHSYKHVDVDEGRLKSRESDFLVFHPKKGILVIEAKAGDVHIVNGQWKYGNGDDMRDPFQQADDGRWKILNKIKKMYKKQFRDESIVYNLKALGAVWFPSVSRKSFEKVSLPSNADIELIMDADDLENPTKTIERIFDIYYSVYDKRTEENVVVNTNLTPTMERFIYENVLCPTFHILPIKNLEVDYMHKKMSQFIDEQYNILNYLEYQTTAVISGVAGTGKTMIALEKARRHSEAGEKVLFLCFNNKLQEHLEKKYHYKNVDFFTIDGFAYKYAHTIEDYDLLIENLLDLGDQFEYKHIIIDEGQDFGQERLNCDPLFSLFEEIVRERDGSFYIFYDKLQLIQGFNIPQYILDSDCKLTLYKNCRNTRNIAETSFKPYRVNSSRLKVNAVENGKRATIQFIKGDIKKALDDEIKESLKEYEEIQILSCKGKGNSIVEEYVSEQGYKYKSKYIPFTTCRKFKGLEADKVIIVDVDKTSFINEKNLFYAGSSRAKIRLSIIASMDDDDCKEVLDHFESRVKRNNPKGSLATYLNADMVE